ncbi:glycosyltransferase family 4 protein [Flagellimonas algicola]|uniref:Glycosyltransferase family 4 protein n=1 Tax=Flagellimonas algicola TaxID=2583815 RepID=A0ABY2WNK4_9FLAO|nr:glycosyltransferase family 4 protein [Allomuricauda algicola]TMU56320.1 glycosyltransferase family 4 protein [Allomuricauda algicola]
MRKVLVIAYYWPPAGGPGVQRWLKFVKYLRDFNVVPVVYVPENPHYPLVDENLLSEVPKNVQILKRPIKEPYGWASLLSKKKTRTISSGIIPEKKPSSLEKILLWVRGNLFIPDARKYWVKPSVKFLAGIIQKEGIKTIITTGPPHSLHLIGLELKTKMDVQWISDFRDPWTTIGYHKKLRLTSISQKKHRDLEKKVLTNSDKIVVTSKTTQLEFESLTNRPIKVITNGFDEVLSPLELDSKFTISHLGSLLTGRNPIALWKVLRELVNERPEFAKHLIIQLAGVVGEEVWESIGQHGLQPYTHQLGYLPHKQVVELQQKSQILLLLEIASEETKGIIPGKLFEYLNARRPILALGPKDWEAGRMVQETKAGISLSVADAQALKNVLLDWFEQFEKGALSANSIGIEKFHRRELTKELVNFITWESS